MELIVRDGIMALCCLDPYGTIRKGWDSDRDFNSLQPYHGEHGRLRE